MTDRTNWGCLTVIFLTAMFWGLIVYWVFT